MHVIVSGGTGFVGTPLVRRLIEQDNDVTVISRSPAKVSDKFDGKARGCTIDDLPETFEAVINLAGAPLDQRWTDSYKKKILNSRVETTESLRKAARERGARTFLSTSAVNYYPDGDEVRTEESPPGDSFLADVCKQWEQAAQGEGCRVAILRLGMVAHHSGGALGVMIPLFRWFLGGRLGTGRQYWSWVHLEDVVRAFVWALENTAVEGAINVTSPEPATNREFTRALAGALNRPVSLPVPAFAMRAMYGEMSDMLLKGPRVMPKRTQELGFGFRFPDLKSALADAVNRDSTNL